MKGTWQAGVYLPAGELMQVQAVYMYGAAQPDFLKSETNGGIKNIISHHLEIIKRCVF